MKAANFLRDWFRQQNIPNSKADVDQEPENERTPFLIASCEPASFSKTVMFYGHIDKQPPLTDQWSEGLGPWTPVIKDGKLYGRGSTDDGYAFFLCTIIIKALVKFGLLKNKIVLTFESDEESNSKDYVYYLQKFQ